MRNILQEIQEKLKEIEAAEHVKILVAVESGSRAWGFASPDSDYDVRFVYLRRPQDYLRLDELKDTIDWQLDEVLDINGWDLKKTLIHFKKGNATLFEWANSPIVYKKAPEWDDIYRQAKDYFSEMSGIYHYYGTARNTYEKYLQGETVKYKKYFYALRPLLACRYIETFHCPPPVLFDGLMAQELPPDLKAALPALLEKKKVTDEKAQNPHIPEILDFIKKELENQKERLALMTDDKRADWEPLNQTFRRYAGAAEKISGIS